MEIKKIELRYSEKYGFKSRNRDMIKHTKVLPWLSVVQSVEGSYDIALGNKPLLQTGDGGFFVAPSGIQQTIVHHVKAQSGMMHCRWIFLDVVIDDISRFDELYDLPTVISRTEGEKLNELFDELFDTDDIFEEYSCYYRILKFLFSIAVPKSEIMHKSMQVALKYIENNFASEIGVSDLAEVAHMSVSNFHSAFKRQFGVSPVSYINNYRLSLAAEYLRQSDDRVSEICERVGINDPLYFSKIFRKTYGLSPRAYRAEKRG